MNVCQDFKCWLEKFLDTKWFEGQSEVWS